MHSTLTTAPPRIRTAAKVVNTERSFIYALLSELQAITSD